MLSLRLPTRVLLCTLPTDMRRSFDSLAGMVREHLGHDPLAGDLFGAPLVVVVDAHERHARKLRREAGVVASEVAHAHHGETNRFGRRHARAPLT